MRVAIERFSELVERIYEAALQPRLWAEIPKPIAELHEAPQGLLFVVRTPGVEDGFMYPYGVKQSAVEIWDAGVAHEDIWVQSGMRKGLITTGRVMTSEELVADEEFLASPYYQRFLKPQDSRYLLSGVIFDGSDGLPTSLCSVLRGHAHRPFDDESCALHRLVTNHLSKAMGTMWRLRAKDMEVASSHAALDRLGTAVVLLDAGGCVAFANARALAILKRGDGIGLQACPHGDRLVLRDPARQQRFDRLVDQAVASDRAVHATHFVEGMRVARPSGKLDYIVQVAPLAETNGFGPSSQQRAVAFISDPADERALDAHLLRTTYGLTPAEIRLAEELLGGEPIADISARLGISVSTARSQLAAIFDKTGTRRQAQLMKLLMSMRA